MGLVLAREVTASLQLSCIRFSTTSDLMAQAFAGLSLRLRKEHIQTLETTQTSEAHLSRHHKGHRKQ